MRTLNNIGLSIQSPLSTSQPYINYTAAPYHWSQLPDQLLETYEVYSTEPAVKMERALNVLHLPNPQIFKFKKLCCYIDSPCLVMLYTGVSSIVSRHNPLDWTADII